MSKDSKESRDKLLHIVNEAMSKDINLRTELKIGDKFRFIRDRLQALQQQVDETLKNIKLDIPEDKNTLAEDEQLVYVYIFNAHGIELQTWIKMMHPSVYYEYSVNRPIYGEKDHIESLIRSKPNRVQHGYLTIAIKKEHVLKKGEAGIKDNLGNPLLKIREGSLSQNRLVSLTHNGNDYVLLENGALKKL